MPAGVTVVNPANASSTCTGGTLTAVPDTGTISYTGGTVAAGTLCSIFVDVTGSDIGTYANTTEDLTSSSGNSGSASHTLTVKRSFVWWSFWPAVLKGFQDNNQTP